MSLKSVAEQVKQLEVYLKYDSNDWNNCVYVIRDLFEILLNMSLNKQTKGFKSTGSTLSNFYCYAAYIPTKVDSVILTDILYLCKSMDKGEVTKVDKKYIENALEQVKLMLEEVSQQFEPDVPIDADRHVTLNDIILSLNVGESRAILCALGDTLIRDILSNLEVFQGTLRWVTKDSTRLYTGTILYNTGSKVVCINLMTEDPTKYYTVTVYRAE